MSENYNTITLIGAGLAGCLLAIYLAKRGFNVEIYEHRPDPRKVDYNVGRSINLTLSNRGIHVLEKIGLVQEVMKLTIPLKGRIIHSFQGELTFHSYGKKDTEVIYCLARRELNIALINATEKYEQIQIYFNQQCIDIDFDLRQLKLRDRIKNEQIVIKVNVVIGTDGSASAIRKAMLKIKGFNFSQSYLNHGYKELIITADLAKNLSLEKTALHVWPREVHLLTGFPNRDDSITCILFAPFQGDYSFHSLDSEEKVIKFFQIQFSDLEATIPNLVKNYFSNSTGHLITIKCSPWYVDDKALLLGDAAHAIVPFYGQGMNCAFEDCAYLDECIEKFGTEWRKVFQEFEMLRKVNTDAIADLSIENYTELRQQVTDPKFLLKKKLELALAEKYPMAFIPKYSMIAFDQIPYSLAQLRSIIQNNILEELCESIDSIEAVNWKKADFLIKVNLLEQNYLGQQFCSNYSL